MVQIKPFKGIRPPAALVKEVASRPYDVLSSKEAKAEAGEKSLLHIIKPEIDFDTTVDEHSTEVYDKAVENFKLWKQNGWLVADTEDHYYVYAQTMDGRTQYGLVVGCHIQDYIDGQIKKHELTRPDKEEDRMIHVRNQNANVEPVFFAYPAQTAVDAIISEVVGSQKAEYDFTADGDGFGHQFWTISCPEKIAKITELFAALPALYVADGHHRTAAAARVGIEKRDAITAAGGTYTGTEEFNYFLAVIFPDNQLKIIDYNRVVKDLNGLTPEAVVEALQADFVVTPKGADIYTPAELHDFAMYLNGAWYDLRAKDGTYDNNDPIGVLDVTILSNLVLDKILGIKDLRTDNRIECVGGIRGLKELSSRVDSGDVAVAFALYPVSMKQLIDIADTGNIMPPKTTWFEPKLRSGLVIHSLD